MPLGASFGIARGWPMGPGQPAGLVYVPPSLSISAIAADGWQALSPSTPADQSLAPVSVVRQGFDAAGQPASIGDTLYLTTRVRKPYPDQATFTPDRVALSDYVYATDTIAGVDNGSGERSPKPIAAWVMPHRLVVADTVEWEIVAFHRNARAGRQVACVQVQASDGTTVTPWQTVASTVISALCEDANPVEVYRGTLNIAALANGTVTLRARVLPWVGAADAVLDSADASAPPAFAPRYFRKDPARFAAPPLVYVASTGSDTTGVVSTNAATAAATPCLTVAGALVRARAALGTGQGALDGLRIRIVDGVSFGSTPGGSVHAQDAGTVAIERAPGTLRQNAIVTMSASFRPMLNGTKSTGITEQSLTLMDVTFSRTNFSFAGETGLPLEVQFKNCAINLNNVSGQFFAASASGAFFGAVFSNWNNNRGNWRIARGVTVTMASNSLDGNVLIGSTVTGLAGLLYADPKVQALVYGNRFLNPAAGSPAITFQATAAGDDLGGFAFVQNLVETTHATSSTAGLFVAADGQLGNIRHAVVMHNTLTGYGLTGRSNLWYDEATAPRFHRLIREVGNLHSQLNTKGDVFRQDGTRLGQFAYTHGVGCEGNYSMFRSASSTPLSFEQGYAGVGSKLGTSQTERQDPLFLDYRGTTGSGGTPVVGAGGGDYRLQPGSPARALAATCVLGFDMAGQPRGTGSQAAGAYV